MGVFDDVQLAWNGKDFAIPSNRVLGAIARIEEHITLPELAGYAERGTAPLAKLAQAYGAVLRFAGATVSDDDVYLGMFGAAGGDKQSSIVIALQHLMQMMVPNAERLKGNEKPGKPLRAAASSSRKRTR